MNNKTTWTFEASKMSRSELIDTVTLLTRHIMDRFEEHIEKSLPGSLRIAVEDIPQEQLDEEKKDI